MRSTVVSLDSRSSMRDRVLEVTTDLLLAGRDAVSTRAVAAAAGTQVTTIYRLFGDKAGLLAAVAERGHAAYLAEKREPAADADPVAELRRGWDVHIDFGLANPALYTLMYGDPRPDAPSSAANAGFAMLLDLVRAIAASGRLRMAEERAARMVHAAACGTVLTLLGTAPGERDPGLADAAFAAVLAAITTSDQIADRADAAPLANALRTRLPDLESLSAGERALLDEWLRRIGG